MNEGGNKRIKYNKNFKNTYVRFFLLCPWLWIQYEIVIDQDLKKKKKKDVLLKSTKIEGRPIVEHNSFHGFFKKKTDDMKQHS
jgi:hypothetical protein